MSSEDPESSEDTLLLVQEVRAFKVLQRATIGGYKFDREWPQSDKIWTGRLHVVSFKDRCEIRLEDPVSGDVFATCLVEPSQRENAVVSLLVSDRHFVLRIDDGDRGKRPFLGLCFIDRDEASRFNAALSDHENYHISSKEMEPNFLRCDSGMFPVLDSRETGNTNWLPLCGTNHVVKTHDPLRNMVLTRKKADITLDKWLSMFKESYVFDDGDVKGLGIPSNEARDIAHGILKISFTLQQRGQVHGALDFAENYGLEYVDPDGDKISDPKVIVHLFPRKTPPDGRVVTLIDDRALVFDLFKKIFIKKGESNFPVFLTEWALLMQEWASGTNDHIRFLRAHPCWLPWNTRLDYFEKVYKEEINYANGHSGSRVRKVVRDTSLGPGWEQKIEEGSALKRLYDDMTSEKTHAIPLFDFARTAASHMHRKSTRNYGKHTEYDFVYKDQIKLLDDKVLEYELTCLHPNLLHDIAFRLHQHKIYL